MEDQSSFSPDLEDLPRFFFGVRGGGNDEQAIQQVDRDAMRTLVVCAADTEQQDIKHYVISIQLKVTPNIIFVLFW